MVKEIKNQGRGGPFKGKNNNPILNNYAFLEKIGEGAFGKVYSQELKEQ